MTIDPTNAEEFEAFAIACWKEKATNLRRVVDMWHRYLMDARPEHDIRQDSVSKLIIALLATQVGVGIHDIDAPRAAAAPALPQRERVNDWNRAVDEQEKNTGPCS
jgi:hypothetical protein